MGFRLCFEFKNILSFYFIFFCYLKWYSFKIYIKIFCSIAYFKSSIFIYFTCYFYPFYLSFLYYLIIQYFIEFFILVFRCCWECTLFLFISNTLSFLSTFSSIWCLDWWYWDSCDSLRSLIYLLKHLPKKLVKLFLCNIRR